MRTIAGLVLLALAASAAASYEKTDNYGLGEGHDPCGGIVVKASKVEKPAYFASPDAINQALKYKQAQDAPAAYSAPANYGSPSYGSPDVKDKGAVNALEGPSPYSGDDSKTYEELQNLLYMKPGVAVAPK